MIEKLQEVENRFEEVNELVCNPDIVSDQEKYTKLMRELKHLTPVVEKFREYKKAKQTEEESRAMLDEGGMDADFAQMVKEEFEQSREDMERIEEELKVLLLPRDPNDDKNVIIEIRGGAGGEESALFAGVLFKMQMKQGLAVIRKSAFWLRVTVHIHALNLKAVFTVFSVCLKPKARAEFILQPLRLLFCPKRRMLILKSIQRICR